MNFLNFRTLILSICLAIFSSSLWAAKFHLDYFQNVIIDLNETIGNLEKLISNKDFSSANHYWQNIFFFELSKKDLSKQLVEYPIESGNFEELTTILQKLSVNLFLNLSQSDKRDALNQAKMRINHNSNINSWLISFYFYAPEASKLMWQNISRDFEAANFEIALHQLEQIAEIQKDLNYRDYSIDQIEKLSKGIYSFITGTQSMRMLAPAKIEKYQLIKNCWKNKELVPTMNCLDLQKVVFVSPGLAKGDKNYFLITRDQNNRIPFHFSIPGASYPSIWEMLRNNKLNLVALSQHTGEIICENEVSVRNYGHPYPLEPIYYPYHLHEENDSSISFASTLFVAYFHEDCTPKRMTYYDSKKMNKRDWDHESSAFNNMLLDLDHGDAVKFAAFDNILTYLHHENSRQKQLLEILSSQYNPLPTMKAPLSEDKISISAYQFKLLLQNGKRVLLPLIIDDLLLLHEEMSKKSPQFKIDPEFLSWSMRTDFFYTMMHLSQDSFDGDNFFYFSQILRLLRGKNPHDLLLDEYLKRFLHEYLIANNKILVRNSEKISAIVDLIQMVQKPDNEFSKIIWGVLFNVAPKHLSENPNNNNQDLLSKFIVSNIEEVVTSGRLSVKDTRLIVIFSLISGKQGKLWNDYKSLFLYQVRDFFTAGALNNYNEYLLWYEHLLLIKSNSDLLYFELMEDIFPLMMKILKDERSNYSLRESVIDLYDSKNLTEDLIELANLAKNSDEYMLLEKLRDKLNNSALKNTHMSAELKKKYLDAFSHLSDLIDEGMAEDFED